MQERVWGNAYRTTLVCVDTYDQGVPEGRLYNPYLPDGTRFHGLMEFLVKMEALLNQMNFPQPFTEVRAFSRQVPPAAQFPPQEEKHTGRKATFALRILFRQNASWQGSVTWLETGQEESFRSVLELLMLINSAMTEQPEHPGGQPEATVRYGT